MFCLYSGLNFSSSDLLLEPLLSANRQHTSIRLANWIPGQKLLLSSSYSSISIFQQCTRQLYLYSCLIYLDPTTTSIAAEKLSSTNPQVLQHCATCIANIWWETLRLWSALWNVFVPFVKNGEKQSDETQLQHKCILQMLTMSNWADGKLAEWALLGLNG